jgi:hypothetical protein
MRITPGEPTRLDTETFNLAMHCVETVLRFRAYTPIGGMLVMLLGKFRDDLREQCFKEPLLPAQRGSQLLRLRELDASELSALGDSVGTLLSKFERYMDDPELPKLLKEFQSAIDARKPTAKAS